MKKLILILSSFIVFCFNTRAEIYHGVDIDKVYKSSDWNNKKEIKKIIDTYTLLLQYQKQLSLCSQNTEGFSCMDKLTEDIIKHFYDGNVEDNLKYYHSYITATSYAYGAIYCLNKYKVPAGTTCNQENIANTRRVAEQYISDLLHTTEQSIKEYSFIQDYKE
jgi:hypothetical protein